MRLDELRQREAGSAPFTVAGFFRQGRQDATDKSDLKRRVLHDSSMTSIAVHIITWLAVMHARRECVVRGPFKQSDRAKMQANVRSKGNWGRRVSLSSARPGSRSRNHPSVAHPSFCLLGPRSVEPISLVQVPAFMCMSRDGPERRAALLHVSTI